MDTENDYWNEEDIPWNADIEDDIHPENLESLVVYSRDWTVETIISQISSGNIDLEPKFQRRNAWTDVKRSKLIESLLIGIPVPEIVFAEDPNKKRSFIVIDGKQRLLTIAGYVDPKKYSYWRKPALRDLTVREELNGTTYQQLRDNEIQSEVDGYEELRQFLNADIRCTVLSNHQDDDVLYDVFYRLNTGSVPLSTQELRQVLKKGPFADYLLEVTNTTQPIHEVLRLKGPDPRLRDVEITLRLLSFALFGQHYEGNLKRFLDESMGNVTSRWEQYEKTIKDTYEEFNISINRLLEVLSNHVGRKYTEGKWEGRFNKALFEVEAYYFRFVEDDLLTAEKQEEFIEGFKKLCDENRSFRDSIEATTKTLERYETRFRLFRNLVNEVFGMNIAELPVTS